MTAPGSGAVGRKRTHLTPFTESLGPWIAIVRNAVPVVGVYALGWPPAIAVFELWWDGVTSLSATIAFQMREFTQRDSSMGSGVPLWIGGALIVVILGIPYWFMLLFIGGPVLPEGFWSGLGERPDLLLALAGVLIANVIREILRGYGRMSDAKIRLEFNWIFSMHLARVGAILLVVFFLRSRPLIAALAVALAYVEIYPMRTLRIMGGDSTLDPGNEGRSKD